MRRGVVGGGNFIVDYVKTVDVYPAEQMLSNIRQEYSGSGGAPYNVLRALSKLGADFPLYAIGRIGDDETGSYILDDCLALGIGTAQLRTTADAPTSYTLVMVVEGTGKRTFFHQRGANARLAPEDFDFAGLEGFHFHYGYLMLLDRLDEPDPEYGTGAARVLANARAAGLTTSIDLVSEDSDRFARIVPPALKHADIVFMNEFEASRASGVDLVEGGAFQFGKVPEVRAALACPGTLVIHWPEGSVACSPDGSIDWQGSVRLPQERIASVVGSGDAVAAGFLFGYLGGMSVPRCLKLGVCCAASCVTGYTCTDSILLAGECLTLGERLGYRDCP